MIHPAETGGRSGGGNFAYYYFNGRITNRREFAHFFTPDLYVHDALGNTNLASTTFPDGWDYSDYYPFGGEWAHQSVVGNHYKFTGKERDPESNLDNFGARFMTSSMGRFMSPDPAGTVAAKPAFPQSWNLYSYALNNPVNLADPTGLWCVWEDGTHDDDPKDGGATSDQCNDQGGHWDQSDTLYGIWTDNDGNVTHLSSKFGDFSVTQGTLNDLDNILGGSNLLGLAPFDPANLLRAKSYSDCMDRYEKGLAGTYLHAVDDVGVVGAMAGIGSAWKKVTELVAVEGTIHGVEKAAAATAENLRTSMNAMDPRFKDGPPGQLGNLLEQAEAREATAASFGKASLILTGAATMISLMVRASCVDPSSRW